jgi:YD repeat-containing protein
VRSSLTAPVLLLLAQLSLSGAALARPLPLLGPGGATWFGPLPPSAGWDRTEDRGVLVVDPATGALWVEVTDLRVDGEPQALCLARIWDGDGWVWRGESHLFLEADHVRLEHQGDRSVPPFPAIWENPLEPWCMVGSELDNTRGDSLTCHEDGFELRLANGGSEHYDLAGQLVERDDGAMSHQSWAWSGDGLAGLTSDDGRTIELGEARVVGSRLERRALGPSGTSVRYEYDDRGQLAGVVTPGLKHRYLYDDQGRLETLLWSDGSRLVVRWDDQDRVRVIEGPGSERWRFEWGNEGLERAFDGRGMAWAVSRGDKGISVRDPAGRQATLLLDEGELAGWRDPAGYTTHIDRDLDGRLKGLRAPNGARWSIDTDERGRLVRLVGPLGSPWRLDWDDDNRLLRIVDPTGRVRRYRTDRHGRVVELQEGGTLTALRRDAAGRVREILHGTQGITRLQRDAAGRITSITDAAGGETRLGDYTGDLPGSVRDPAGGTWTLAFDRLARVRSLRAPDGGTVTWVRNPGGGLAALSRDGAELRMDRRADGTITRMVDPLGRLTGWTRDAVGRITSWLRPDGTELKVSRDARGDPQRLQIGEARLELERDMQGRPIALRQVGTEARELLGWARNLAGQITTVTWPQGELKLARDAAGLVRQIDLGSRSWELERDAAGRLRAVQEGDRTWRIRRDDAGLPTGVEAPSGSYAVILDPRGLPSQAAVFDTSVTWRRDAAGRPARLEGPGGVVLGIQRNDAGRAVLHRLPDGALLRSARQGGELALSLEDGGGRVLYEGSANYDAMGRLTSTTDIGGTRQLRYGPSDELQSVEEEHAAWSVFPGRHEGPPGSLVVNTDARGRPLDAVIELAAPAWGVARRQLSYQLDQHGRVVRVEGDAGVAELEHDPLGRLVAVSISDGQGGGPLASWQVDWDPFGRPESIRTVDDHTLLCFLGGRLLAIRERDQAAVLLEDARVTVMASTEGHSSLVTGVGGFRELALFAVGEPYEAASTPGGLRDLGYPGVLADGGRLQLFPGGPLLGPSDARDPLSGLPTAGTGALFPWQHQGWPAPEEQIRWPALDGASATAWDPEPWTHEGPWDDPLALLVALGELQLPLAPTWWEPSPSAAPLPWMPASLEGRTPAVLPPYGALPLEEGPVAAWLLAQALPPATPAHTEGLLAILLEPELEALPRPLPALPLPANIPWNND